MADNDTTLEVGGTVQVLDAAGDVFDLPSSSLDAAIARGYRVASAEDVHRYDLRQKFGDATIRTALEGAASGVTLGISDVIQGEILDNREEIQARRELNPVARGIGEFAGIGALALATGGLGAGAATGEVVGTALAKTAAQRAAEAALRVGARGAVEGAVYGAAGQARDDYLADAEQSAERILLAAGIGGLAGGAIGGSLAAGGSLIASAGRRASSLFSRTERQAAATAATERAVIDAEASSAAASSADVEMLSKLGVRSDDQVIADMAVTIDPPSSAVEAAKRAARQREAAQGFDDLVDIKTRKVVRDLDELFSVTSAFEDQVNKSTKPAAVRAALAAETKEFGEAELTRVRSLMDEMSANADELLADERLATGPGYSALKGFSQALKAYGKFIDGGSAASKSLTSRVIGGKADKDALSDALTTLYMNLDNLKTRTGQLQGMAGRSGRTTTQQQALRSQYFKIRSLLEDADVWGAPLAEMQRLTNAAETEKILKWQAFRDTFTATKGLRNVRSADPFDLDDRASDSAVKGFLRNSGDAGQMNAEADFGVGLRRLVDMLEVKGKLYPVGEALSKKISRSRAIVDGVISDFREVAEANLLRQQEARAAAQLAELPLVGQVAAKVNLELRKGIAFAAEASGRARTSADAAAEAAARGEAATSRAADGLVASLVRGGKAAAGSVARAGASASRGAPLAARVASLIGADRAAAKAVVAERAAQLVADMGDRDSDQRRVVRLQARELARSHPAVVEAAESALDRQAQFLSSKLPPARTPAPGEVFGAARERPRDLDPKRTEDFLRAFEVTIDPSSALERMATGNVQREDVEVLEAIYPREFARLRLEVLSRIDEADRLPKYRDRVRLSLLLGSPADPSMSPQSIGSMQSLARKSGRRNAEERSQARSGAQVDISENMQTRNDRIISQ